MLVPLCVLAGVGALILHAVGHTCNESLIHGPVAIKRVLAPNEFRGENPFLQKSHEKLWPEGADGDGGSVCGEC